MPAAKPSLPKWVVSIEGCVVFTCAYHPLCIGYADNTVWFWWSLLIGNYIDIIDIMYLIVFNITIIIIYIYLYTTTIIILMGIPATNCYQGSKIGSWRWPKDHGGYGTNLSYGGPSGPMVSGQMDSTSGFGPHLGCIFLARPSWIWEDWNRIGTIPRWNDPNASTCSTFAERPVQVAMGLMIV